MTRVLQSNIENSVSSSLTTRIRNRRLQGAVDDSLSCLLYPAERLHDIVESVEVPRLDLRATLGSSWPWLHRTVLLVTDRRLLELAVRPMGRSLEGRVRNFPWSRVAKISCDDHNLRLTSRDGEVAEWILRSSIESSLLLRLKAGAGLVGEKFGSRVCDRCGAPTFNRNGTCSGCDARVVDPREVAGRGWLVPASGLMMTRHGLLGAGRLILELTVVLTVGMAVLASDSPLTLGAVAVCAIVLLTLIKIESVRIARVAADRSGVGMRWNPRLWNRLRVPGLALLVALLVTPFFFVGYMESRISADLDFVVPEHRWKRSEVVSNMDGSLPRSVWSHRDGWSVTVTAEALNRFVDVDAARLRLVEAHGADVQTVEVPNFEAVLVLDPAPVVELPHRSTRLELLVFDRWGRDVHTLATRAPTEAVPHRAAELQDLLRHAIWTEPHDLSRAEGLEPAPSRMASFLDPVPACVLESDHEVGSRPAGRGPWSSFQMPRPLPEPIAITLSTPLRYGKRIPQPPR